MELLTAVKEKNLEKTKNLLAGAGPKEANFERYEQGTWGAHSRESPIHHALFNLQQDEEKQSPWRQVVIDLIKKGATVNASYEDYDWRGCGSKTKAFEVILNVALSTNDGELLDLALKSGGDPNMGNVSDTHSMRTDGRSVVYPIHTAASHLSYDCTKALLNAGANVNAVHSSKYSNERGYNSNTEETALHMAIQACVGGESEGDVNSSEKLRVLTLLLESGANVEAQRQELEQERLEVESPTDDPRDPGFIPSVRCVPRRESPLTMAVRLNLPQVVRVLVAHGADVESPSYSYGETPPQSARAMAAALKEGSMDMLEALNAKGNTQ